MSDTFYEHSVCDEQVLAIRLDLTQTATGILDCELKGFN